MLRAQSLNSDCLIDTKEWFTVYDQYRRTHCVASDLIMGNEYVFRVFANNLVGSSQEPCSTKDSAYIQKTGGQRLPRTSTPSSGGSRLTQAVCLLGTVYKPPTHKQHDLSEAPKFTRPLVNRSVIAGYNATLSCSVRGTPKVSVEWRFSSQEGAFVIRSIRQVLTCVSNICRHASVRPAQSDLVQKQDGHLQ